MSFPPSMLNRTLAALAVSLALLPFAGCKTHNANVIPAFEEDVAAPTQGWGLRKLDPKDYPDMKLAWLDKTNLERAIDKSLQFLRAPSSQRWYPSGNPGDTITHDQIVATLDDIKDMIHRNITPEQFQQEIVSRYDVYTSVGYNGKGDVWFTGYFTPHYEGSRTRTAEFQYPIYSRPNDLQTDPLTGKVLGTYPIRRDLMASGKLRGLELLWFRKPIEPFMIQVQGSAEVHLTDGQTVYVGFAGSNGAEHKGLGMQLRDEGKIDPKHVSLPAVLAYFDSHPGEIESYILKDDRFTFQKIYTAAEMTEWPTGSLNVQVTTDRTIATDKNSDPAIFPRASFTMIDVAKPAATGAMLPYKGFVLDQDNGGGIRAAGRADIYMGRGDAAGARAGEEFAQGHLYYIFLKPEQILDRSRFPDLRAATPAPARAPGNAPLRDTPARSTSPARPAGGPGDEMFPGAVRTK